MERGRGRARLRGLCLVAGPVLMALGGVAPAHAQALGTDQAWPRAMEQAQVQAQDPLRDIPDLALVVTGDSGRTETWRSGQSSFARLWTLLQPTYAGTERVSREWEAGRYPEVRITVVWGLTGVGGWPRTSRAPGGDVAVEREDQLFVAADGTPWVRTDPAPEVADDDIRWHRAPRAVFAQMERAGALGGTDATGKAVGDGAGSAELAGRAWWAAAGVAVGVGGTLLIRRAAARGEAGPPREEPRQELIDL
ncbi:hypothetical protein [Streptomyces prunicolor]|uniref:Secreted protein n=1 Tax=Streptomyces prunicolor TaxID=67348 RepID=A0ABU4FB68_9ACTN|nr:hypothetical protein [Streptomyces prunicolor]MDV7217801.1 hypothetical protein [Streptomyces prunicolor]